MNEKLSINIEIPGSNSTHNFLVPCDMGVSKMISLILQTLKEEYPNVQSPKAAGHKLIQESTGKMLLQNCSLKQLGIVTGETLLLI